MSSDPKQAFRMALKKSPCVRATLNGSRDWRAFRIIRKCHKICTAENSEGDFMKEFMATSPTNEEQNEHFRTQANQDGFSVARKDLGAENQRVLPLRNDDGWKYEDNYEMNLRNDQFSNYDTEFSWNPEASLLDFLNSLADVPDHPNTKPHQSPISSISCLNNDCFPFYQNPRPFSEISEKQVSDSNLCNQNYDLVHSTLTELTPSSSNSLSARLNLDEYPCENVGWGSDGSTSVTEAMPRSSSCSLLKHHPCQCPHYHVSPQKQTIEEIMPCDAVGVSPWILSMPPIPNKNNSSKCNTQQKFVCDEQINLSQEKDVFNKIAFEIESAAIERLLEEEKNCFDAIFHSSTNLYREAALPNMSGLNDYPTTVNNDKENPWLSPFCSRSDNIALNSSPTSDFISYKLSSEPIYYG